MLHDSEKKISNPTPYSLKWKYKVGYIYHFWLVGNMLNLLLLSSEECLLYIHQGSRARIFVPRRQPWKPWSCNQKAEGDVTLRSFLSSRDKYSLIVAREAMWYMLYNIVLVKKMRFILHKRLYWSLATVLSYAPLFTFDKQRHLWISNPS